MNTQIFEVDPNRYDDAWLPQELRRQMPQNPPVPRGPVYPEFTPTIRSAEPPAFTQPGSYVQQRPVPPEVNGTDPVHEYQAQPRAMGAVPETLSPHHDLERRKAAYGHAKEVLHDRHFETNGERVTAEMDLARFLLGE